MDVVNRYDGPDSEIILLVGDGKTLGTLRYESDGASVVSGLD